MNFLPEYAHAPILPGDINKNIYRKRNDYAIQKRKYRNIRLYDHHLFLKAAQNLCLMQADVDFARNSIKHQEISINQISSKVSYLQKEVDLLNLEENYKSEVQKLREGYKQKVDKFKGEIDFANQVNLSILNEINQQADEAEKEAEELTLADRERFKKEFDNYFDNQSKSLKQQLKEAQSKIIELQDLSDKATLARKKIDDYKSLQNEQKQASSKSNGGVMAQSMKQKTALNSSRVAVQYREYQEKNQKPNQRFYPHQF